MQKMDYGDPVRPPRGQRGGFGATCGSRLFAAFWRANFQGTAMSLQLAASRFAGMLLLAFAQAAGHAATPSQQASVDAITQAMEAVVGLQVTATQDARSAETLGREREGSGVVIGPEGLILTIGYLI